MRVFASAFGPYQVFQLLLWWGFVFRNAKMSALATSLKSLAVGSELLPPKPFPQVSHQWSLAGGPQLFRIAFNIRISYLFKVAFNAPIIKISGLVKPAKHYRRARLSIKLSRTRTSDHESFGSCTEKNTTL